MFKLDSPLMNFLNKVCDIMILNVLLLICSLPIVTAGASITAAYYMCFKMVRNEEGYIVRGFFKAFKENFKQATGIWLIILAVIIILLADFRIIAYSGLEFSKWIVIGLVTVSVIIAMGVSFVFALQARFINTVKNTIKNSFLMALSHLPSAILFVVSYAIPVLLLYFLPQIAPLTLLLAFGGLVYLKSFLFLRIFKKYEEALVAKKDEETEKDELDGEIFAESDHMTEMSENEKEES